MKKRVSKVRKSFFRLPWVRFLLYWLAVLKTGFDNRVARQVFRQRANGKQALPESRAARDVSLAEPGGLPDSVIKQWKSLTLCENVIVNFDLCTSPVGKKGLVFEEGFIRIGNRISPRRKRDFPKPDFHRWPQTRAPMPSVKEFSPGKTAGFLRFRESGNVALTLNDVIRAVVLFDKIDVPVRSGMLISSAANLRGKPFSLATALFDVRDVKGLQGSFLLRRAALGHVSNRAAQQASSMAAARGHLLAAFGIEPRSRSDDGIGRIILVSRRDRQLSNGRVNVRVRKISNEDEIVAALQKAFPSAEIRKTDMAALSIKEQLDLIHHTDILVGMHGAALGFSMILPPNAGVLELFPAHFMLPHYIATFYPVVLNNGGHYRRWINLVRWREFSSDLWAARSMRPSRRKKLINRHSPKRDFTRVPPQVVVSRVRALQRKMRKAARSANAVTPVL